MAAPSASVTGPPLDGCDIFTTVPSEILIKIFAQLPSKCYLDLVHTSKTLRNLVKINASGICNEAIRTRFPLDAAILKSELESGWVVPRCEMLKDRETRYGIHYATPNSDLSNHSKNYYSLLCQVKPTTVPHIRISSPGPQYLHFLEQNLLVVGTGPFSQPWAYTHRSRINYYTVDVGGETYYFNFMSYSSPSRHYRCRPHFNAFMERFNWVHLQIKDGRLEPPADKSVRFPRELVWFYGVERLRIVEEEGEEDWKRLPMLLWE